MHVLRLILVDLISAEFLTRCRALAIFYHPTHELSYVARFTTESEILSIWDVFYFTWYSLIDLGINVFTKPFMVANEDNLQKRELRVFHDQIWYSITAVLRNEKSFCYSY